MAHVSEKVKVNMLLLWCGPDGEDIYEGFNLDVHHQYNLDLIWAFFYHHCEPICNFWAAKWKFRTVSQTPSGTLDTFYNRIFKLSKQCQFEPAEEKSRLIDSVIYGTSIVKAQEKLLQTPKLLTLSQCLSICRHYKTLKLHLDTIKPKQVEYLQRRHGKAKGHGSGQGRPNIQQKPGMDVKVATTSSGRKPVKIWKCGSDVKHFKRKCPAWRDVCKRCGLKGHYEQLCGKLPLKRQPKNVQEINNQQSGDTDQNTGKIQSNVDIVNMIRSLGLHEQCEAKRDSQLRQKLQVHELNIFHGCPTYPVFKAPVFLTSTGVVWGTTQDIMNFNVFVATEKTVPVNGLDVITVHDVESKCAIYSYCTIAGQTVKIKQDTGAEVNVMSKHVFKR